MKVRNDWPTTARRNMTSQIRATTFQASPRLSLSAPKKPVRLIPSLCGLGITVSR